MKRKFKLSSQKSKSMFTRNARRTKSINNMSSNPMRGGYRL